MEGHRTGRANSASQLYCTVLYLHSTVCKDEKHETRREVRNSGSLGPNRTTTGSKERPEEKPRALCIGSSALESQVRSISGLFKDLCCAALKPEVSTVEYSTVQLHSAERLSTSSLGELRDRIGTQRNATERAAGQREGRGRGRGEERGDLNNRREEMECNGMGEANWCALPAHTASRLSSRPLYTTRSSYAQYYSSAENSRVHSFVEALIA